MFEILSVGKYVDEVWNQSFRFPRSKTIQKRSRNSRDDQFSEVSIVHLQFFFFLI